MQVFLKGGVQLIWSISTQSAGQLHGCYNGQKVNLYGYGYAGPPGTLLVGVGQRLKKAGRRRGNTGRCPPPCSGGPGYIYIYIYIYI